MLNYHSVERVGHPLFSHRYQFGHRHSWVKSSVRFSIVYLPSKICSLCIHATKTAEVTVCVCVFYMYVHLCIYTGTFLYSSTYEGQRIITDTVSWQCLFCFSRQSFSLVWNSLHQVGLLVREPQYNICLYFSSARITYLCCHSWLFGMGSSTQTSNTGPLACEASPLVHSQAVIIF